MSGWSEAVNTAQLIVLWDAGLLMVGVLLVQAPGRGPSYLIAAIGLIAGLMIYTLQPHPARKRCVAVGVLAPPFVLALALWGYTLHRVGEVDAWQREQETTFDAEEPAAPAAKEARDRGAEAIEAEERRAAEAQLRDADAAFLVEIKKDVPREGRWLPIALAADHIRYFVDLRTVEVVRTGKAAVPLLDEIHVLDASNPDVPSLRFWVRTVDGSGVERDVIQLLATCRGRRVSAPGVLAIGAAQWWAYRPGAISEDIVQWVERSKWCRAALPKASSRDAGGARSVEDGAHSYSFEFDRATIVGIVPSRIVVKVGRALTPAEEQGFLGRLQAQCPMMWDSVCSGRLDDGQLYKAYSDEYERILREVRTRRGP